MTAPGFIGTFAGRGTWYDAARKSGAYRIHQTTQLTPDGFEVAFKHDFDDGAVVEAKFSMTWSAPNLFRVDVAGAPVGNGYVFGPICHYHMKFGDKFVEVSYYSNGENLEVSGSSSTNAEGNYTAWKESLQPKAT